MEKSGFVWNPTRSVLGLMLLCATHVCSLNAKEIFDIPIKGHSDAFDFSNVKTVSFCFFGNEEINADRIVDAVGYGKADIIITGEKGIEGRALSPNISIDVIIRKNVKEKACLVTIDAYINGESKETYNKYKRPFTGCLSIERHVLVFSNSTQMKEIENAVFERLQEFANTITSSATTRPTFFVVH